MLEREGGHLELILGDGILRWETAEVEINHPVLFRRVQLSFDPKVPEFTVIDSDREAELYMPLLQAVPGVDGRMLDQYRVELEQGDYHPLGKEETNGFLTGLVLRLSPRGRLVTSERDVTDGVSEDPQIARDPVIFLRDRSLGMSLALSRVLQDMRTRADLPGSLLALVEEHSTSEPPRPGGDTPGPAVDREGGRGTADDILFAKPANLEQRLIAERLERHKAVLVQGPPGTGKTHTIANLIGHLLARGERVLVTSHTTKALRVLREQVVEPLRPLCVSLLEGDVQSRQELQSSVQEIASRLDSDPDQMEERARSLSVARAGLIRDRERLRNELLNARADEYRAIVVAGQNHAPSDAARLVAQGIGRHDWIPSGLSAGDPLPLSPGELADLYRCAKAVTAEDEHALASVLPDPKELANPDELEGLLAQRTWAETVDSSTGAEYWAADPGSAMDEAERIDRLVGRIRDAAAKVDPERPWRLAAIDAGAQNERHRIPWEDLVRMIEGVYTLSSDAKASMAEHAPRLPENLPLLVQKSIVGEAIHHLERRGKLGLFFRLTHPAFRSWVVGASVRGRAPGGAEEFRALARCEPTTHRSVLKDSSPLPHRPDEGPWVPPAIASLGVGQSFSSL
jgi:hypothetical protein